MGLVGNCPSGRGRIGITPTPCRASWSRGRALGGKISFGRSTSVWSLTLKLCRTGWRGTPSRMGLNRGSETLPTRKQTESAIHHITGRFHHEGPQLVEIIEKPAWFADCSPPWAGVCHQQEKPAPEGTPRIGDEDSHSSPFVEEDTASGAGWGIRVCGLATPGSWWEGPCLPVVRSRDE